MAVLEDGPGIWVLLGQGRSRYLHLPLPRDTHLACPCGHMSPAGHLPVTISQGLCSAFSSSLKWKHFKGLCFFFFPPPRSVFLCKQLITSLKGSSSPPSLPRGLEAVNIKQFSAGIKVCILFCLKLRRLLFGGCLGFSLLFWSQVYHRHPVFLPG